MRNAIFALVVLGACAIPNTQFRASPDGVSGDAVPTVLAIVPSDTTVMVNEGGMQAFTVTLNLPPSGPLAVTVTTTSTKIGLDVGELDFTPDNFGTAQTVTVYGLQDADTVDEVAPILLAAPDVDSVTVTADVHDDDVLAFVSDIGNNMISIDEGTSATVHLHLSAQPTSDISVTALLGTGPVTIDTTSHVYTSTNYDVDQAFVLTAPQDANTVNETETLTFRATGIADQVDTITDIDDDTLNISVSPANLTITEQGSAGNLNVALTQMPQSDVTIMVGTTTGKALVNTSQLTFTPANYATNQTVQVTAPADADTMNDSDTVTLMATGLTTRTVAITIIDDDVQSILDNAPNPLPVSENATATFNVTLKFMPTANVNVTVATLDGTVATASPGVLTFTPLNYATGQTVTVHGTHDNNLVTNNTSIRLSEPTIGNTDVPVAVADIDTQTIVLSTTTLMIPEGTSQMFGVSLMFDPGTTVMTTVVSTNPTSLPVSPATLTFTSGNFATAQQVTVSPPVDSNNISETAVITVSGAGASPQTVMATAEDSTVIAQYGWPTPFTTTHVFSSGAVSAMQVVVGANTTLDSFGIYIPAASGTYRMALYTDNGNLPGDLVASIAAPLALANGTNIADVLPDVPITMGTYWIAFRIAQTTAVGESTVANGGTLCIRSLGIGALTDPWPEPFGSANCSLANLLNLWINTYHQ